jgi:hypothetical protein
MLYGDYMVTNELIESQRPRHQLNNSLTYMGHVISNVYDN